ncbi:two-component system, NtrC family, response regulator AtoC [Mucilaginibacter gossypiicola]|uniref:Two-component system, NtrC family, response regulator AtoC n=1 Tax=Mucilaginibacter gossypiicola TaxID=551995 RepID=A0A1H8M4S7_9SPHI|nr:sigma-54 dependent transcriptional regulator [Mucilaginibacter gossypiicola]SEO12364.1 two-component system, NtrC family, response regulator AtoC [Mucilaginibacter gossypiicola]
MNIKLLIVDNQVTEANYLKAILEKAGYFVSFVAYTVPAALSIISNEDALLVLLDLGIEQLGWGQKLVAVLAKKRIPFVYLVTNIDVFALNTAKQNNAYGILVKPYLKKDVSVMMEIAFVAYQQKRLSPTFTSVKPEIVGIISKSKAFLAALEKAKLAAQSDIPVLIYGESGTGKEMIARAIHALSIRNTGPLIVINCAAFSPAVIESEMYGYDCNPFSGAPEQRIGKLEQANGGTILLDGITELPVTFQAKFVQNLLNHNIKPLGSKKRRINVRVIATTSHLPEDDVARGHLRVDLYYYLNMAAITLPLLKECKEDIPLLASHFVSVFAGKINKHIIGLSDEALMALKNHSWPGNIRELKNLMERCVLLTNGNVITSVFLSPDKDKEH